MNKLNKNDNTSDYVNKFNDVFNHLMEDSPRYCEARHKFFYVKNGVNKCECGQYFKL